MSLAFISSKQQASGKLPDDDASGDRNIHGMLRAELCNLQAVVAGIDNTLVDTLHLVAEDDGNARKEAYPQTPTPSPS